MKKIFKNKIVLASICLILCFVIAFLAIPAYQRMVTDMTTVVIAKEDIEPGVKITEDMLQVVEMSVNGLPEDVAHSIDEVMFKTNASNSKVSLYAATKIMKGYFITGRQVAEKLVDPMTKIRAMQAGESVVSISLSNVNTVSLFPNDIISIYQYNEKKQRYEAVTGLTAVSVVCTLTEDGTEIVEKGQVASDGKALTPSKIEFILSQDQSRILASISESSKLWFSLIYRGENQDIINSYLATN